MKKIYQGKTKDVYEIDSYHVGLQFKDDVTGKDGVFDPGENQVGLSIEGQGHNNVTLSTHFFNLFEEAGIKTHVVETDLDRAYMKVRKVEYFGQGLEVIVRYKAVGSFLRRYASVAKEMQDLNGYLEFTLKDDLRNDPLITEPGLIVLGLITEEDLETVKDMTSKAAQIIFDACKDKGLDLIDLKLEFGKDMETGAVLLIDEVSSGNMRVYQGQDMVDSMQLAHKLGVL